MQLPDLLSALRLNRDFMRDVVAWERLRPRPAQTAPIEAPLSERLLVALRERGIDQFFTHQAAAINAVQRGENVVIATATASGKSLCYTVPVLQRLIERPKARALYLFPTKALAHDQLSETAVIISNGRLPVEVHGYDGDTPQSQRRKVRAADGILITNLDMLHAGMLPYHPTWRNLLRGLEFVVLDEIHAYTGVFGSHVANVVRRLRRLCEFYGSSPQFICCSATIANPQEHAQRLVGAPFTLVDEVQNGAPTGEKHFILYNPPIIDEELGLRGSSVLAAKDTAVTFLAENVQTIVFARARQTVELLLTYIQDELAYMGKGETAVTGYRGGYLPLERRDIELGLRTGSLRGVVATNALELGIDIGQLDAAVITGYPGSIASVWQQAGRAGRRAAQSAAVLIASNSALDQYICNNPRYLFGRSPEHALTNPDNLRILLRHLGCAAFELPFRKGETFGGYAPVDLLLDALREAGDLYETREQYHWLGEGPPSHAVSLRTSGDNTVLIHDMDADNAIIGEIDLESVPLLLYEGAIYMHQARTYLVESLDWDGRIAHVRPVEVDYYTRASVGSTIRALRPEEETLTQRGKEREGAKEEEKGVMGLLRAWGDVTVVTQATGYRKIKRYTHETLGFGLIDLPQMTLETSGYWLIFGEALTEKLYDLGILLRPNEYGPNWQRQRKLALERDGYRCRMCGAAGKDPSSAAPAEGSTILHVHHVRPFREFNYIPGENDHDKIANDVDNLLTLCPSCHRQAEAGQQTRSALGGLGYVLRNLAPLFLMCDPGDILVSVESQSPLTKAPTLVIYERIAAGVGFSQRLYELHDELLHSALELVSTCRCRDGCPACVGPPGDIGPDTKDVTRQLLKLLTV
ncbi:MAG: DEAD/DEAH box helicase [Ardenticatenaceae bacterium]|nr:DEAD/DEAH box helicase [Anaerolineales bacterium]MCB8922415.1 DEAD/DEAH box helicase [Ardenticatenaceae bacterium]MCB8991347.1 DEAD/DEAH box helicase [Ardenticatenaceae bacterium]